MKEKTIKANEIYKGTICELTTKGLTDSPNIVYISEGEFCKVDNNMYYDFTNDEYLPAIIIDSNLEAYNNGKYVVSPQFSYALEDNFIFTKNVNGINLIQKPIILKGKTNGK